MDMEDQKILLKMIMSIVLVGVLGLLVRLYDALVKKPERVRSLLRKQGITGPPPTFLLGNLLEMKKARSESAEAATITAETQISHDYSASLLPFFEQWTQKYGKLFTFSLGNKQILHITQADLVKEITTCTSLNLGRPSYHRKEFSPLFGEGILTSNGPTWQYQKKILAPELHMDKVKGMTTLVWESAATLLESWQSRVEAEGGVADLYIDQDLLDFSGDVISRACFGSNYSKGKEIFLKLNGLKEAMSKRIFSIGLPGVSYLPTKTNREIWRLVEEVHKLILKVVKERKESGYGHKDLLQTVLEGAENSDMMSQHRKEQFIVDNCKTIYLAAQETVAITAAWCLMLLASNPEWQARVRAEVLEIWGGRVPDSDMLRKVKQLTMVIQETLRLYPPGVALSREVLKEEKMGGIQVPEGVNLWTMVMKLHADPETWGPDSHSFNPERFANGISGACKLPQSYLPFGFGPRVCLGQNLAMLELKMAVGLLLSNFSFSISPKYVHSPVMKLVIEPKHGINLLVKKL